MKKDEIEAGQEYLVGTSPDWENGHYCNERVRVLDTRGWTKKGFGREHRRVTIESGETVTLWGGYQQRAGEKGILVEMLNSAGENLSHTIGGRSFQVYDPRYFRGTWEEASALVEERLKRRDEARKNSERESREASERQQATVKALKGLGFDAYPGSYGTIKFGPDEAEKLLDTLRNLMVAGRL